ncbi:hypothetical protein [Funiculus sociatus]
MSGSQDLLISVMRRTRLLILARSLHLTLALGSVCTHSRYSLVAS